MPPSFRLLVASTLVVGFALGGAGLAHVERATSLEILSLGYTKVADANLEHLFGLTKLHTLYLTKTRVTGAGVKELRRALPTCNTDIAN